LGIASFTEYFLKTTICFHRYASPPTVHCWTLISWSIGAPLDRSSIETGGPVTGVTLNDLPPAVVKGLQRCVPDAVVDSIVKQVKGDQATYVVTFKDRTHPAIQFASDGSVVAEPAR
jgi:hypothetical protein